jgi:hypothetical protein
VRQDPFARGEFVSPPFTQRQYPRAPSLRQVVVDPETEIGPSLRHFLACAIVRLTPDGFSIRLPAARGEDNGRT